MKYWLSVCIVYFAFSTPLFAAPLLEGVLAQGGLAWGNVSPNTQIVLDGKKVRVHESGFFVIGFGRDASATSMLEYISSNGEKQVVPIEIAARTFDIERVNGLPPKTVTPPPEWTERRRVENGMVGKARAGWLDALYWKDGFIKPAEGRFSGFYGSQRILNGKPRSPHYGLDIAAAVGTPIVAPAAGIVRLASPDFLLEGGIVIIDHGWGVNSTLFHMDSVSVKVGQFVQQGELIGTVGSKGRASGPHVDWRINWQSVRLDPLLMLEGLSQ
jgi:murein DD-endopeptidase MepM/ murein hydrolase activator NlpD